ncbi:transcription elongation factor GreA [bacterium]|nr:transcription elongation factor GreA [bacterium]
MANLLTKEGYKKLSEELEHLKKVKRRDLSKAIGLARELGDLKENAEYHSAKEEQGRVEAKIRQLETTLADSNILEHEKLPDDQVCIGIKVKLKNLNDSSEITYTLVSPAEANYEAGKISIISPVAKGLLGKKVGDKAEIRVPAGMLRYEILDMER